MHIKGGINLEDKNQANYVAPFENVVREERGVTR